MILNIQYKFIILWIIIIVPFLTGSYLKYNFPDIQQIPKKLIRLNLILLEPLILLWTIWGLKINNKLIILPISGLLTVLIGALLGYVSIYILKLKNLQAVSYLISSTLANQGMTMGGFLCYLIAGETGLGYAMIYAIYFLPVVFIFIFPYARFSSHKYNTDNNKNIASNYIIDYILNIQNLPICGILFGLIFQITHIPRPEIWFPLDFLLYIAITIYYLTLGINFRFSDIGSYNKEQIYLSISKFLINPALLYCFIYITKPESVIKKVIMIQSFMPAAIYSVISSILFDLDYRLTSELFVVNSVIFLLFVLPMLIVLMG